MKLLAATDIDARLAALNRELPANAAWTLNNDALCKTFVFADFVAAFAFMTRVAAVAESLNHHPDWRNAWNRVEVTLSTHDAGGITVLDFTLAQAVESCVCPP